MEANLTEAQIYDSNTNDLAVVEEENDDEIITAVDTTSNDMEIDLEDKHKTEAYQNIMNSDIENIYKI